MSEQLELGPKIGLIGDAHGNVDFLIAAARQLASEGASSLVQLGDFGVIWGRNPRSGRNVKKLECALDEVGLRMFVVLGNHEDYDEISRIAANESGIRWVSKHLALLPRAGRTEVGSIPVGWLSGAGSIDFPSRIPGSSWWRAEIPTDEEVEPLYHGVPVSVLFAHDALATPNLIQRLSGSRHIWDQRGLAYAEQTQAEFTQRALAALAPEAVVLSGHYHFPFRDTVRLDGGRVIAQQLIFNAEWNPLSLGLLMLDGDQIAVEHLHVTRV